MAKTINDPVFGDLEYNEEGYWTKKIFLGIWGGDDFPLELVVQCRQEEKITDVQRNAYNLYLAKLPKIAREFPDALLMFFKNHYEDFNRNMRLGEDLKLEIVDRKDTFRRFCPLKLFINQNGDYGWKGNFITSDSLISIIFSDDKFRIFKGWTVLNEYARIEDDVFGEMFFDQGWKKWIKTKYNRKEGEWLIVQADAEEGQKVTPDQKANYQKYFQNEKNFLEDVPHIVLEYYLQNYEAIAEMYDIPEDFNKENIDLRIIMIMVDFQRLYFNRDGVRYGWLCKCMWDNEGLAIYYDGKHDGICVGTQEDLVI